MKSKRQSIRITVSMAANNKKSHWLFYVLFVVYLIFLLYFLFFSDWLGRTDLDRKYRYNLSLFREIKRFYRIRETHPKAYFLNVYGNVLAFMPFGFLIPRVIRRCKNLFLTVLFSFELSLAVEVLQLVFRLGSFDVDDLLLNTFGGLLGYLFYRITAGRRKEAS